MSTPSIPIALAPADWFLATWRTLAPLPCPAPEPFDLQKRLATMANMTSANEDAWNRAALNPAMSIPEARLWYEILSQCSPTCPPAALRLRLLKNFDDRLPGRPEILSRLRRNPDHIPAHIVIPLVRLTSPADVIEIALNPDLCFGWTGSARSALPAVLRLGIQQFLIPYLDQVQRDRLRDLLRERLRETLPASIKPAGLQTISDTVLLAAAFGLHAEMDAIVSGWPDTRFERRSAARPETQAQWLIFGLGSSEAVRHHMHRLKLRLVETQHVHAWLANTELADLAFIRDSVLACTTRGSAERLMVGFSLVEAPEAAPLMIELKLTGKAPHEATQWLEEDPARTTAGLADLALLRTKQGDAARQVLRDLARRFPCSPRPVTPVPSPEQTTMTDLQVPANVRLDPVDWFLAGWRKLPPLPLPEAPPFNRADCLKRLAKAKLSTVGGTWNWGPAGIPLALTQEEARFWLWAMVLAGEQIGARDLAAKVKQQETKEPPSLEQMRAGFAAKSPGIGQELAPVLCTALSREEFVRVYLALWPIDDRERKLSQVQQDKYSQTVCMGFLQYVRPYLTPEQLQPLQAMVRPLFQERLRSGMVPQALVNLARALELHDEIAQVVASWPDGSLFNALTPGGTDTNFVVAGLGDAAAVQRQMARLALRLGNGYNVRAFLAHTGTTALTTIRDQILATYKTAAEDMTEAFGLVETPEMAPLMLELLLANKGGGAARRWLDTHTELTCAGLLGIAGEKGKMGEAALDYLRDVMRSGHTSVVETQLTAAGSGVAERVRKALQAVSTAVAQVLDEESLPEWFKKDRPTGKVKLPAWLEPAVLTPVTLQGRSLTPEYVTSVLSALKDSTLPAPGTLVVDLKKHADRASLEAFSWDLFERWLNAGSPAKDKWAMSSLGLLGGDDIVLKLWPLVRDWPGQGAHKRAVHGLECLRAIGTEQALLQLRKLADKVKFPALKRQAQQFMHEIATERGLTESQLEDRIVPDLGLDQQGTRLLDFGPRQFRVALGPDLKARVRDNDNKIRTDLPKGTAKDDAAKVEATTADWKLFKQQLKEVLKTQSERLEKAMTRRRRWSVEEFEKYLIHHPFMRYLAQVLLWAGFDPQDKVQTAFRVTEDCTYADVAGEPVALDPGWKLGVIHPLFLSAEDREKWAEVFADHEIIPPFAQLGRKIFLLDPAEVNEKALKRFEGQKVHGMAFLGATKKTGWEQGSENDSSRITRHYKHFPEAGVTAFLTHQPGLEPYYYGYGGSEVEEQEFGVAYFVPGRVKSAEVEDALPLGQVDALVLNEVASLMYALSGKKA